MPSALMQAEPFESVDVWLARTYDREAQVRKQAAHHLCPCRLQADYPRVWERLLAMVQDPDRKVRAQVFHSLADGSPRSREPQVVAAIESMRDDPDPSLRRHVRQLLAHYRRGGRLNVL